MTHTLAEVFSELGMSQYLGAFLHEGFDSWGTILDITESDLCVALANGPGTVQGASPKREHMANWGLRT
jgi:hypothetical protein